MKRIYREQTSETGVLLLVSTMYDTLYIYLPISLSISVHECIIMCVRPAFDCIRGLSTCRNHKRAVVDLLARHCTLPLGYIANTIVDRRHDGRGHLSLFLCGFCKGQHRAFYSERSSDYAMQSLVYNHWGVYGGRTVPIERATRTLLLRAQGVLGAAYFVMCSRACVSRMLLCLCPCVCLCVRAHARVCVWQDMYVQVCYNCYQ